MEDRPGEMRVATNRIAKKRYRAITRQGANERTDDTRSGNSASTGNAEKPEAARPTRSSYALRTRPRDKGGADAAIVNSRAQGSQRRRRHPALRALRRLRRWSPIV